ncbi:MAG: polysaccharide biosynthesis/export family protein [Pirellulales bacterium]|nr:polysaccharide biosynthesis/export family protein [Pirellulales bacterium]
MPGTSMDGTSLHVGSFSAALAGTRISAALGLVLVAAAQLGCVSAVRQQPAVAFVEPPRAELEASLAQDRIKASDVLQLRIADGTTATVTQTYHVAPDGTVEIAGQGKIQVADKTIRQAQQAIQKAMAVSEAAEQIVDLSLSEYYLVVVDENGTKRLTRVPIKGEVNVQGALAHVPGVSRKMIWIARPEPSRYLSEQILPVDWETVSRDAASPTNYALKPGDWLFVAEEPAEGLARVYNSVTGLFRSPELPRGHTASTKPPKLN